MTNVVLITKKLAMLEKHLQRLRERRPDTFEAFEKDPLLQDAVAMSRLVVVQEALDIALHIASDEGWEVAETYREAFAVLERHGLIEASLANTLSGSSALRNRIAHGYASVNQKRLWAELPGGIRAFSEFAARVAAFLSRPAG